jgi:hypothetical protein
MQRGRHENKKKVIGQLRRSQLVTTFGTGAIADMPDYSVIIADAGYWNGNRNFYDFNEPNLQRLLGKKFFREPAAAECGSDQASPDIPSFRFPRMLFCPNCHKLRDFSKWGSERQSDIKECPHCHTQLVPSRFVAACINGHLEDFPYSWWVHGGYGTDCSDPYNLEIHFLSNTGGLGSIEIECMSCHRKRTMDGCMSPHALAGYRCRGKRPWIGMKPKYEEQGCEAPMQTLQRGASNVYFSMTQSAITIPPWSNRLNQEILREGAKIRLRFSNGIDEERKKAFIEDIFIQDIQSGRCSADDILKEIYRTYPDLSPNGKTEEERITSQRLFEDEYKALCTETDEDSEEVFKNEKTDVPDHFREYFSDVYLVRRLREVMVLKGFRRITPEMPTDEGDPRAKGATKEFMPVSYQELDWLPANRLYGEGIFIRFNEDRLKKWEKSVGDRYEEMRIRLQDGAGADKFSPRYVLLHTFSHLLIRQLTSKCGYSGSAIRERIYSTYRDHDFRMAGVLVYTSSSDSDGSLGGLVRQGEPEELDDTILNLLQEATWCSSDPLCIESKSQGYNALNYAACHACTLLPETSCEARNCLLDRVAVVGKDSDRALGYFGDMLED